MTDEIRFVGDLQKLALQPGDVLVLKSAGFLPMAAAERLHADITAMFPGHKCVVLDGGTELGIVSP